MRLLQFAGIAVVAICTWLFLAPVGLDWGAHRYNSIDEMKVIAYVGGAGTALIAAASLRLARSATGILRLGNIAVFAGAMFTFYSFTAAIRILHSEVWAFSRLESVASRGCIAVILMVVVWSMVSAHEARRVPA